MGPTRERRLKPDVVAPGTDIYAALSRRAKFYGDTATSEDVPGIKWRPWSGTSQAMPFVAGCAAILREALQDRSCPNPPGALLKAIIINSADRLANIDINAQGHGRVNLPASIAMTARPPVRTSETNTTTNPTSASSGTLIGDALKQDEEHELILSPPETTSSHSHFKITMVYNDIGHRQIQNNLNLFVTDIATGETTPGNRRSLDDVDEQNNVEQIVLSYIPKGGIKVRVHAQKILAKHDQDYVLAWSEFTPLQGVVY